MARFAVGDTVRVGMPKGFNKRGVVGVSVMYATWPETRFDGAIGTVRQVNPRGTYGIPLYLVDFTTHDNARAGLPWQSQWFREEWLAPVGERAPAETIGIGGRAAADGMQATTLGEKPN